MNSEYSSCVRCLCPVAFVGGVVVGCARLWLLLGCCLIQGRGEVGGVLEAESVQPQPQCLSLKALVVKANASLVDRAAAKIMTVQH